jgi:hypothetical protein
MNEPESRPHGVREFESLCVERSAIDAELCDEGLVGPELAHLSRLYLDSPRALVWQHPSPDWRLFIVLLPLASRLSLMTNPIFTQLTRAWGLTLRFIGIDRNQLVYDFRKLLSDRTLHSLIDALARARSADVTLDVLFATLSDDLLTVLDHRRDDWSRHLVQEHRLEPGVDTTLLERTTRFPDFLGKLREALRDDIITEHFYGRALRSIDAREDAVDARIGALTERHLSPATLSRLRESSAGQHLGCYNWITLDARHAAARAHVLSRLPSFATFFAESLLPLDTWDPSAAASAPDRESDAIAQESTARREARRRQVPTLDLPGLAARRDTAHSVYWSSMLRRAIDAGQDRVVIEALAQRFAIPDNVIRRLWREQPKALGQPPTWHLTQILRQLATRPERDWPQTDAQWRDLRSRSIPLEALGSP